MSGGGGAADERQTRVVPRLEPILDHQIQEIVVVILLWWRQNNGGSSSEWQKVKTIPHDSWAQLIGNVEKYPLLCLGQEQSSLHWAVCFTLDIETFQLEKVCALGSRFDMLLAYSNFPASLSSPTISSGAEKGPEEEMLEQGCATSSMQSHHVQNSTDANAGGQAED